MQKGKIIGIIQYNPQLVKYLSSNSVVETLTPRFLPMLVHPMPWLNYNSGGYLMSPGKNKLTIIYLIIFANYICICLLFDNKFLTFLSLYPMFSFFFLIVKI